MKHIIRHIMFPGILLLIGQVCLAGPIKDLESKAVEGRRVPLSGVPNMEVVVVSDCLSENTALNPNVSYKEVDLTKTEKPSTFRRLMVLKDLDWSLRLSSTTN